MKTRAYLIAALALALIALASACVKSPKDQGAPNMPVRVLANGFTLWIGTFTDTTTGVTCYMHDTPHGGGMHCFTAAQLRAPNAEAAP